ncbi:MAG: hypothetical protein ACFB8W_23440 [Elainellaceae cyanobacterium]
MSEDKDLDQFFPDEQPNEDELVVELPASPPSPYQERIPSGYDPMGEIYLRGRAYQGLARGSIPWWVLISGWVVFGGTSLFVLFIVFTAGSLSSLPLLLFPAALIAILWRGTSAKLAVGKRSRRRR